MVLRRVLPGLGPAGTMAVAVRLEPVLHPDEALDPAGLRPCAAVGGRQRQAAAGHAAGAGGGAGAAPRLPAQRGLLPLGIKKAPENRGFFVDLYGPPGPP